MLGQTIAYADSCTAGLGNLFVPNQANKLCRLLGTELAMGSVQTPILISTPVVGTNFFAPGLSIVPATATANTAAYLGQAATPIPGQAFIIYNGSASTVRAKAGGGATINSATAGGYMTIPTLCQLGCRYTSATNLSCGAPACPTAQGP